MSTDQLTEDEVAERAGMTVDHVRHLVELGILEPEGQVFRRLDVLRARVVADLEAKGIGTDAIATAARSGDLTFGYLESAGRRPPRSDRTFAQLCEESGVPFSTLERIYVAWGLPRPTADERVREEDLGVVKILPILFGAGVSEGEVLRVARVWGDSSRRIAQFQSHYFHATIEEPFRERGLRDNEAYEAAIREVGV